jgi:transposase
MARTSKKEMTGLRARRQSRRMEAAKMFAAGASRAEVARKLGVSWQTSHTWFKAWRSGGEAALKSKGKPGPAPIFDDSHRQQLAALLAKGPQAHGYDNALWSLPRVRAVVAEQLGIRASTTDIWRLLRSMRWSPQKPARRARERKENKIREWKEKKWPEISARAARKGRTIVFVDESGLSQRPARKRTWAPEGQTPVLEFNFNWKKLSAIAGVSLTSVYFELHEGSVKSAEVVAFLKHLRGRIRKPITIIWDGLRAHWSKEVRAYVATLKGQIELEQLPAYAPELNPVEYLWGHIKQHELANLCPKDLHELSSAALKALFKAKRTKSYIRAFWVQADLPL